jgi:hypothetical protein
VQSLYQSSPNFDTSGPVVDRSAPVFDRSVPMFDRSMPLFDRSAGSQDHNTRGSDDPSGVLEHLFDREGWNDMASVLRDINETQLSGGGEGGPASPMKAYHMESEVIH